MAISFHTTQNKKPALPQVLYEDRVIPYNTETEFLGVHINENMKWITHISYLSSKLNTSLYMIKSLTNITSAHFLRIMYFACFHIHLRYGVTLWGGDPKSNKIFRLKKKAIRILSRVGKHVSCRNVFKDLNILPLPCLYISEIVYRARLNWERMRLNEEIHDHDTWQKSDLHTQYCRTTVYKNNYGNVGIKLFNKLPNSRKKVGKPQEFKRRLQKFLMQRVFYSIDEYMPF